MQTVTALSKHFTVSPAKLLFLSSWYGGLHIKSSSVEWLYGSTTCSKSTVFVSGRRKPPSHYQLSELSNMILRLERLNANVEHEVLAGTGDWVR
jgi:hypothetical protein